MIYPTSRAIFIAAAGAPVALVCGLLLSSLWPAAALWSLGVALLVALDARLGASQADLKVTVDPPPQIALGGAPGVLTVALAFAGQKSPREVDIAVGANALLTVKPERQVLPVTDGEAAGDFAIGAVRRGEGRIEQVWLRWTGPLGLAFRQRDFTVEAKTLATPNIAGVREEAIRLFSRTAPVGEKLQIDSGDGSEYRALHEFQQGMDPRSIDWTQSARHRTLLAKEYNADRNNPVYLVLDTGRLMCEPVAGQPKIDRALNAALLLAYACLKAGDRIGLFAFDARPRLFSKATSGPRAFPELQRSASAVDYSTEETNFTLGLASLNGSLDRRALVVIFTDFADSTGAELMLENVGRILRRHLVMFVVFRDEELESLAAAEPLSGDDVSRAVIAEAMLRERQVVLARLRRMGAEIVEAPVERLGPSLIARYLELKRKDRL